MAAIVYQTNKKTGVVYAYESVSHWDKEKRQSRARRRCLGRLDPATGEIVPTRKRAVPAGEAGRRRPGPAPAAAASRLFYGATYLFDRLGEETGVAQDLKACFPETYRQILSVAYYLILEDRNPLSRFPRWAAVHKHPCGEAIPSQRSSELFASVTEEARQRFFRLQGRRRAEREYLAYDTTSVSSYSQCLRQVRYGKNKDHEHLAQINLALLFGQQSGLPFYYRKLAGHIPDVKTLRKLLADLGALGYEKVKVVLDRGFFSAANIDEMYSRHLKFLVAAKLPLKLVETHLDPVRETMRDWNHYHQGYELYAQAVPIQWSHAQARPRQGETVTADRRMYLHLYFSPDRALEEEKSLLARLAEWQGELESGRRHPDHEAQYARYFEVKSTPVRGTKALVKEDALAEAKRNYGYFALLSNEIRDPVEALAVYRNKDMVEKAFDNLKERLSLRRTAVSSEQSLDGKLFVQFVALIFLSCLAKRMRESGLFKDHTLQEVLDDLDVIECFEAPGRRLAVGETTKRQSELYARLGVAPPGSLQ